MRRVLGARGRRARQQLLDAGAAGGRRSVTTIEGVALDEHQLHAVQQAFIEHGGAQCGICTPGMVLAAVNLLERHPNPTDAEIRTGLAGNLCRCTGYMRIFEAVARARGTIARARRSAGGAGARE